MKDENRLQLRQALLELHYDLLDDPEAQALRDAIERDPEVAAEWERTLRLADQLADVARLQQVELPGMDFHAPISEELEELSPDLPGSAGRSVGKQVSEDHPPMPDSTGASIQPTVGETQPLEQREGQRHAVESSSVKRRWWWATSSSIAAVAAMLGMLLIGSWYFARIPEAPATAIRLEANRVPEHLASSDHEFRIVTSRVDSFSSASRFPVTPASLSFSVLVRGTVLYSGATRTSEDGSGKIVLPQELLIPPEATLQVRAESTEESSLSSRLELPLEPTRCVTYLTSDRPIYRPGETIFFRSLTLLRGSLKASAEFPIRFELVGPDGTMVGNAFLEGVTEQGVGNGSFVIPTSSEVGPYTLWVKSLDGMFPDERFEFQVRAYRAPRFKKEIRFSRRSYGAGERVEAVFSSSLVTGEPLSEAVTRIEAVVEERVIYQSTLRTATDGTCEIDFLLPKAIFSGEGQLLVTVGDGVASETEVAAIPIQTGNVVVDFYPEGGELVEGLENRIYFTAHDGLGAPVQLEGEIVDSAGHSIAAIATLRDGMGKFQLQPVEGEVYRFRVTLPNGSQPSIHDLPEAVSDLPVLDTGVGVFDEGEPVEVMLRSDQARSVLLRVSCRGELVEERKIDLLPGENRVELPLNPDVAGVVRVTILDSQISPARPLVERLVYRRPARQLAVEVVQEGNTLQRSPGDSVDLILQVRNENGDPTPAVLGVSVVDEAAWSLDRLDRPSLSTQLLLLSEIENPQDLERADFYLSGDPGAAEALDLLLGTQGWRRFIGLGPVESSAGSLREQLIHLLELDGPESTEEASFDNSSFYASEWLQYQQSVQEAGRRFWVEFRILAIAVALLWLAVFLIHRGITGVKLASSLTLMAWMLFLVGCGSSREGMWVQAPTDDAPASESVAEQASVESMPPNAIPDSASDHAADTADEVPAPWVDWLDDAKVAWLLRIAQQPRDSSMDSNQQPERHELSKQELRQLMAARGLDAAGLADELLRELRFPIRQYAHRRTKRVTEGTADYSETICWQPLLITDERGRATIRFDLPDTVTQFRIQADAHAADGRLGSGTASIRSEPSQ